VITMCTSCPNQIFYDRLVDLKTICAKFRLETWLTPITIFLYTGCPRRKGPNFERVFLRSNYTDKTQNTFIQISMITEILVREFWIFDSYYSRIDILHTYWNWQEYVVSVILISVHNIKVNCEWHKTIK
jgi:hypothetical protein